MKKFENLSESAKSVLFENLTGGPGAYAWTEYNNGKNPETGTEFTSDEELANVVLADFLNNKEWQSELLADLQHGITHYPEMVEGYKEVIDFVKGLQSFSTNYRVATKWLNNSLVMCNHIGEIDPEIYDNMRFSLEDEETGEYREIYQWFITDCSESEVLFLEEHFNLLFTYSPVLDCYILAVDHYGTAWSYVYRDTDLEQAARELGEEK